MKIISCGDVHRYKERMIKSKQEQKYTVDI